jgi:dsDNA-binding SOS-regulon protein
MAVIVKYVVVRNGVEKMTFTTKKEADAYDKMLDIADELYDFMDTSGLDLNENLREELSLFLARNRDQVMNILKGAQSPKEEMGSAPEKTESRKKKTSPKDTDVSE